MPRRISNDCSYIFAANPWAPLFRRIPNESSHEIGHEGRGGDGRVGRGGDRRVGHTGDGRGQGTEGSCLRCEPTSARAREAS
jgi:hypothetical protein